VDRNWFKLVGATPRSDDDPIRALPDDWEVEIPSLKTIMRFPKHRAPKDIMDNDRLIAYAVGKGKLFAVQTRNGDIRMRKPYGPAGSVTFRYPNELDVVTHAWVGDLRRAPLLSDVRPDFTTTYKKKFWNGSHWRISDEEYAALEAAIVQAGQGKPAPELPRQAPRVATHI
jgi:hypothetical protein